MPRLSPGLLSAIVLALGATAQPSADERTDARIRRVVVPGPEGGAMLVVPPGVESVVIGTPREVAVSNSPVAVRQDPLEGVDGPTPDWRNSGGNSSRNGLSSQVGPASDALLWSVGPRSIVGYQAFTERGRMFVVRQNSLQQRRDDSAIYALDLDSGATLWHARIPFEQGDFTTWIAGVKEGVVYASRSGNGATSEARVYALEAATGHALWISADDITAEYTDGVVFAPDGDLIIGDFESVIRINSADGSTVWKNTRVCGVSGSCGAALFGNAVYLDNQGGEGGQVLVRYDLATGARLYASVNVPGSTQNTPMVGPDGTIYLSRQINASTDFFYAFHDTGAALVEKWHVASASAPFSEFAVGTDGSVYMIASSNEIHRLDPETGATLNSSEPLPSGGFFIARMAIDALGRLFFSEGVVFDSRLRAFEADLTPLWDVPVDRINIGGPSLGDGGTLITCGANDIRAYRDQNARPSLK